MSAIAGGIEPGAQLVKRGQPVTVRHGDNDIRGFLVGFRAADGDAHALILPGQLGGVEGDQLGVAGWIQAQISWAGP